MRLDTKLTQLADDLSLFADPQERLAFIVDRARRAPPLPPADRIDAHRVRGCISVVWLVPELREGLCCFRADAESPLVRGLVLALVDFFSGATAAEIAAWDANPLDRLGLTRDLSPTRRHGLAAVHARIQEFARTSL